MKYKLINTPNPKYNALKQVLTNRGLPIEDIENYINLDDSCINDPTKFGEELMEAAAACFLHHVYREHSICVIVDCDCDGYTSSAILINYIYDISYENYVQKNVSWYMHENKQHGLSDCMNWIEDMGPNLVIIPDAGTNDIKYLDKLLEWEMDVIILDHHDIEEEATKWWKEHNCHHAFLINSQSPEYPNKFLSGAGVVYQFCRYIDQINKNMLLDMGISNTNLADQYLDLVATGLDGDMMSLQSYETRRLISKGLDPARIINPFIYGMWQKNKFKLTEKPTAWGFTFYVVPLINAITRSGTLEEKELIFESMLKFKAHNIVPSTKRGHKIGEQEQIIDQALRTCTNVKNRQTRAENAGVELVEDLIQKNNMLDHKVLLFLLEPGTIKPEIRGLIANKAMAKYQRPCCMLTKVNRDGVITYEGSARGCDKVDVTDFKGICAATGVCEYTIGHPGAFGLGIKYSTPGEEEICGENLFTFIEKTDELLKDMPSEPVYYVDYIWDADSADIDAILDIADMDKYWGKDIDESFVAIKNIKVTKDNLFMMASNTVKIELPNGVSLIKFRMPDEEYKKLYSDYGFVKIDIVGKCNCNTWNGIDYPQILIENYNVLQECLYEF